MAIDPLLMKVAFRGNALFSQESELFKGQYGREKALDRDNLNADDTPMGGEEGPFFHVALDHRPGEWSPGVWKHTREHPADALTSTYDDAPAWFHMLGGGEGPGAAGS